MTQACLWVFRFLLSIAVVVVGLIPAASAYGLVFHGLDVAVSVAIILFVTALVVFLFSCTVIIVGSFWEE